MKLKHILSISVLLTINLNILAQSYNSNKVEIGFKNGEIKRLDLDNKDDSIIHRHILDNRINEIKYRKVDSNGEDVYSFVQEMPDFPGGHSQLSKHVRRNVKYPKEARKTGLQGKVYVKFIVDRTGNIRNIEIARGVHPHLDAEAIRIIQTFPRWLPGKLDNMPVNVFYIVPINFML